MRALCDYALTHFDVLASPERQAIRDEILRLGKDIHAQTSWGILNSKRDIDRIAENYDKLITPTGPAGLRPAGKIALAGGSGWNLMSWSNGEIRFRP